MIPMERDGPAMDSKRALAEQRYAELDFGSLLAFTASAATLAERSGIPRRTVARDATRALTIDRASRYADALGVNPAVVWPAWVDILEAQRREELAAYARKYRRTRAGRAVARRAEKKYKHSVRDYQNRYQRQWRDANRDRYRAAAKAHYERNRVRILAAKRARYQAKKAA